MVRRSSRLVALRVMMLIAVATLSGIAALPTVHADFISVTGNFTNKSDQPLTRQGGDLAHGCWDTQPPTTVAAGATVTWKSSSCPGSVLTGTEGYVDYAVANDPSSPIAHFYWDDPTCCLNHFDASVPSVSYKAASDGPNHGDNVTATYTFDCSSATCDGIPDDWKTNGVTLDPGDGSGPHFIDLPKMGATVNKPDIFVQIDWMAGTAPGQFNQQLSNAALTTVITSFANAPYRSRTGSTGINLHVDEGPNSILNVGANTTWGSLSRARALPYQANLGTGTVTNNNISNYNWTAFDAIKNAPGGFTSTGRTPIFHYEIAAHNIVQANTNSGISRCGGASSGPCSDTIISLGTIETSGPGIGVGTQNDQSGTFMHELGHNLGLAHGGGDGVNFKPDYFSIMNYSFQFGGLTKGGATGIFDYSRAAVSPALNENSLSENSGVGPGGAGFATVHACPGKAAGTVSRVTVANANGAIDWNCNGTFEAAAISYDINNDPNQPANTLGTLNGYDDWSNIRFRGGAIGQNTGSYIPPVTTTLDEPPPSVKDEILPLDTTAPVTTATVGPPANTSGWNNTNLAVTLAATDDISGIARTEYNLDGGGWIAYTTPINIATEGTHSLQYRSIDRSQNVEGTRTLTIKLDKTKPTVSYSGNAGSYTVDQTVTITCTAADTLSGVASTTCKDISGPAYSFALAANSLSATATDNAGNVGTGQTSFTVVVTAAGIDALVDRFVGSGSGSALTLRSIMDPLGSARTPETKAALLQSFDAALAALQQVPGGLTAAQATILSTLAHAL